MEWFVESKTVFDSLNVIMMSSHQKRTDRLHEMPKKAQEIFWWPFTQHKLVSEEKVTVIDSRCGENFSVHKVIFLFLFIILFNIKTIFFLFCL